MVKKLRVIEAFSGIGSQTQALKNIGVDHEVVATIEWDINAIKSYYAIHCEPIPYHREFSQEFILAYLNKSNLSNNGSSSVKEDYFSRMNEKSRNEIFDAVVGTRCYGSLPELDVEDVPDHDLFTYSFPCQDISVAGKQGGLDKASGTRSSLLWYCRGVIAYKKPKYLLMENVKNLVGKKHKPNFDKWLEWLEEQGYTNYWKILNAKDYGIPQNRERVFVVSIRGDHKPYTFPKPKKLKIKLKDIIDDNVDDKYFLSKEKVAKLLVTFDVPKNREVLIGGEQKNQAVKQDGISTTLTSSMGTGGGYIPMVTKDKYVQWDSSGKGYNSQQDRAYYQDGLSPTISSCNQSGTKSQIVLSDKKDMLRIKNATEKGYLEATNGDCVDISYLGSKTKRGRVQKGISHTVQTGDILGVVEPSLSIRKLTPLECWRLMGFKDEQFYKAEEVNSNSQLYKQAGNSIVVNVLEGIFTNLFKEDKKNGRRKRRKRKIQ